MPPIRRLLVANRGEIAIRILRTCREMGVVGVAIYSDADADAPHVRHADVAERIGPAPAAESYLKIDAVLAAADRAGADAVHPGYGFLSENAAFAEAVGRAGLTFVGPPVETLRRLGDKLEARRLAEQAAVPVVPGGSLDRSDAVDDLRRRIGLPLLVKAAAGGGGRGMRRVDSPEDLPAAVAVAAAEAQAAFGSPTVYLEKVIEPARHIEVQLLGDQTGRILSLGERDCSVQRRHQKLVEEAPAPGLDDALRQRLADDARAVAGTVAFGSAATVEFLVDADGNHYFLEVNTRLQVEHGVTELLTGLDLVAWQIRIAGGESLPPDLGAGGPSGHAIEVRLYAEDPFAGFGPTGGTIGAWRMPAGPGVRVEAGVEGGQPLPPEYDPLLVKVLVQAEDRQAAVARLRRALDETLIGGVATDLGFHRWLVDQPGYRAGGVDTGFIAREWAAGPSLVAADRVVAATAAIAATSVLRPPRPAATPVAGAGWIRAARQEAVE